MTIIDHPGQTLLFADLATIGAKSTAHVGKRATISKGGVSTHAGEKRPAFANKQQRVSVLDDLGNAAAPKGSKEWLTFWINEGKLVNRKLEDEAYHMRRILKLLEQYKAHEAFDSPSFEQLCRKEFGRDAKQIEALTLKVRVR